MLFIYHSMAGHHLLPSPSELARLQIFRCTHIPTTVESTFSLTNKDSPPYIQIRTNYTYAKNFQHLIQIHSLYHAVFLPSTPPKKT